MKSQPEPLTPREREVLSLRARGLTGRAIAEELGQSPHTTKNHLTHILEKLGVHSSAAAVQAFWEDRCAHCPYHCGKEQAVDPT